MACLERTFFPLSIQLDIQQPLSQDIILERKRRGLKMGKFQMPRNGSHSSKSNLTENHSMKMHAYLASLAVAGFIALSPMVAGQDTGSQQLDNGARKMMKSADTTFAVKAAQGGIAEVKLGKLAADKGSNPDIKAFGQQMVEDHTKANDDLKATAQKQGMTLPTEMNAKQQAMYDKLSKLSGAAFDRAYARDMVKDHEEDVKEFQKEANSGTDDAIKAFAARTLPVIQGHLDKIKSIEGNLGASSQ